MAIDRRNFLAGCAAGASALALGAWAPISGAGKAAFAGCYRSADGSDHVAVLSADGRRAASATLPGRGHGMAERPGQGEGRGEVVVFARRPGTFALALDVASGEVAKRFDSVAGHHFQGHGIFSADGRYLFTAENHFARGSGVVGIHDAADGYKRIGELDAYGIGTHDLAFMPDGKTLALANGGILTHPDSGRAKLNLATMRPSLAYVDAASGRLLVDYRLADDLHQASIRHMAVNAEGTVVVVFQYEGAKTRLVPLVGIHAGEDAIQLPAAPVVVTAHMRHYCGSVAFDAAGRHFAVTSPRGNFATFWNAAERRYVGAMELADVCGAAAAPEAGGFYLSSGAGGIVEAAPADTGRQLRPEWLGRVKWDNHLLALGRARA
jgi:hypothetical protein